MDTTGARLMRVHVRQLLKSRGSGSEVDRISWFRKEIVMSQEETVDSAIKHDHLQHRLGFECGDNFVQFRKSFRAEDVERRMIERHAPVGGRPSRQTDLLRHRIDH